MDKEYVRQLEQRVIQLEESLEMDKHLFKVMKHGTCYKLLEPLEMVQDNILSFNRDIMRILDENGLIQDKKDTKSNMVMTGQYTFKYILPTGTILKIFNYDIKKLKTQYSNVHTIVIHYPGCEHINGKKFKMYSDDYNRVVAESCLEPIIVVDKKK